jgi:hypothetical protein
VLVLASLLAGFLLLSAVVRWAVHVTRPAPQAVDGLVVQRAAPRAGDPRRQAQDELRTLRQKMDEWRSRQRVAREAMNRLEGDERLIVDRLTALGVRTAADLKGKPRAQVYAEELQEIVRQRAAARQKVEEWEEAVIRLESIVRRTERAHQLEQTGITDGERAELFRMMLELDGRVETLSGDARVPQPNLDALLNERLKRGR